jgi:hypothetical protein
VRSNIKLQEDYLLRPTTNLDYLPQELRIDICDWMLNSRMAYSAMKVKLKAEHNFTTSEKQLSQFYRRYCLPELMRRRAEAAHIAAMRAEKADSEPADFCKSTLDVLWEKAFTEAQRPESAVKDLKIYVELLARINGQILDERKVELMQRRLALVEKKQAAIEQDLKKKSRVTDDKFLAKVRTVLKGGNPTNNGKEKPRYLTNGITH